MFEWETEENLDWDALEKQEEPPRSREPNRRWLWFLLVLTVLVSATAVIVWRRVNHTLQEAELRVENDVLASVALVHQTAKTQDGDLFTTFLSGRDASWALAQERALLKNELFARDALGMTWLPADSVDNAMIELAPDLLSAQVTLTQTYGIDIGNALTETVVLTQTAVYRLGPNRWLYSPPDEAYWGQARTYTGTLLNTTYFERDEAVARRLARDLDAFLLSLCDDIGAAACASDLAVEAVLTGSSPSFSEITRFGPDGKGTYVFSPFPSPSVAGWPTNEVSYQALYRGYAAVLGFHFLNDVMMDGDAADNPFYHALRAELLWRQGIRPFKPPVPPKAPQSVNDLVRFHALESVWRDTYRLPVDKWDQVDPFAYQFVDMMLNDRDDGMPALLFRALFAQQSASFESWAKSVASLYWLDIQALERLWLAKQYPEPGVALEAPPIPLPKQNIALICQNLKTSGYELYTYDINTNRQELIGLAGFYNPYMQALPNDENFAVGYHNSSNTEAILMLWQDGTPTTIRWRRAFDLPDSYPIGLNPKGDLLLLGGEGGVGGVIDHERCQDDGGCGYETVDGLPHWSPNGRNTIVQSSVDIFGKGSGGIGILQVSDRRGQRPSREVLQTTAVLLGNGHSPTWISINEVAWVSEGASPEQQMILRSNIEDIAPEPVLSLDALRAALPDAFVYQDLAFNSILSHPLKSNHLLITTAVSNPNTAPNFLLEYDLETETGRILDVFNSRLFPDLKVQKLSPNDRFGLITYFNQEREQNELLVYDFETGRQQLYAMDKSYPRPTHWYADWSADGAWLLTTQGGYLRIIAPEFDYQQLRFFGDSECDVAVWLNK